MENSIASRQRYRSSMRVAWISFLPWALATLLLTLFFAMAMNWLFSKGWYIIILAPCVSAVFVTLFVSITIQKGKCRFPALAGLFGFAMGLLLYGGYFYFGMLSFLGPGNAARLDLLPKYIQLRLNSDTQHDVERPDDKPARPDPVMTGVTYAFEFGLILLVTTVPAYRRSKRAFCEKCGQWKLQDLAKFPPNSGAIIRQWLEQGQLANLATLPKYTPPSAKKPLTIAAIEWCGHAGGESCLAYFGVKDISRPLGTGVQFDESFGKITVPRVELTDAERAALSPVFPKLAGLAAPAPTSTSTPSRSGLIEIKPIPPAEAHKVLNKISITIANFASILILVAFFGSIAGVLGAAQILHLLDNSDHHAVDPARLAAGLALAFLCLLIAIFSGYIGIKNPGIAGDLWYRVRALNAFALHRSKLFDPQRATDLPTFFVGVTPRKNWGQLMMEMSEDIGFLQIDPRKAELRFEGDVEQYRIPASAITSCALESYSASAANTRIEYWAVVVQGRTAQGFWEAPFYPRKTKWFLPSDHRRESAEEILTQITELLPLATSAGLPENAQAPTNSPPDIPPQTDTPAPAPQSRFSPIFIFRILIVLFAVAFGVWRGIANKTTHPQTTTADDPDPGPKIVLQLTNIRTDQQLTTTSPYCQPGGDWTVFDCNPPDDPQAKFTIAIQKPAPPTDKTPFSFSHAQILPSDPDTGSRFVQKFAAAFEQDVPDKQSAQPLQPLKLDTAVLGQNLSSPQDGLKDGAGSWVSTKWFIQNEGLDGEVFFDYDLTTAQAEFTEKDPDYDEDVIMGLAIALRDGPRPLRTPQNDPNFSTAGPQVAGLHEIPDSAKCSAIFAPGDRLLILCGGTPSTATAVSLEDPSQRTKLAEFDGLIIRIICADPDANALLVSERLAKDPHTYSPNDTVQFWWIDRSKNVRRQLKGPWGTRGMLEGDNNALSPDAHYAAIQSISGTKLDNDRKSVIHLIDLQSGSVIKISQDDCSLKGWTGSGPTLRAVITDDQINDQKIWLADPTTGTATATDSTSQSFPDSTISPDHHYKLLLHPKASLDILDLTMSTTKTFTFHPDDHRFAVPGNLTWLSPRYIQFQAAHPACIDVTSMKMSYLPVTQDQGHENSFEYSHNFIWAMQLRKTGVSVGRVDFSNN